MLKLGGEYFSVEGEILVADHQKVGKDLSQVVGKLDGIAIAYHRKAVESKPVGDGAEDGIVFHEYDS